MSQDQPARPSDTAEHDLRDQISRLTTRIEELTDVVESCRKLMLIGKVAILSGGAWLLAVMLGIVAFSPIALISASAAVLGGIVVFGSNTSTAKQAKEDIKRAEARRADLAGQIDSVPRGRP